LRSIDGWAILQHLKFDSRTRNIPVIVTSIRNIRTHALNQGAQECLIKPVSAMAVANAVERLPEFRKNLEGKIDPLPVRDETVS
ncbi:MAG: hypothetical protein WD994_05685, partial [Pseudomonadales bacterium]